MLRYVFYVRKSSEDFSAQAKSLSDQIKNCLAYAETHGLGASTITSTSALSELAKDKTLDEALKISAKDIDDYLGTLPKHKFHCSVLGHQSLEDAIKKYRSKEAE